MEMRRRARCGGAEVRSVGPGLGPGKELGHGPHGQRYGRSHGKTEIEDAADRHRREVGGDVVRQLPVDVRVDGQHRRGRLQDRAAVGRLALDELNRDLAAGTRAVFDHRRSGVAGGQLGGHTPADGVGGAARRKAGDDAREFRDLCHGLPAERGQQCSGTCAVQHVPAPQVGGREAGVRRRVDHAVVSRVFCRGIRMHRAARSRHPRG